jgi:hypothetical protein
MYLPKFSILKPIADDKINLTNPFNATKVTFSGAIVNNLKLDFIKRLISRKYEGMLHFLSHPVQQKSLSIQQ